MFLSNYTPGCIDTHLLYSHTQTYIGTQTHTDTHRHIHIHTHTHAHTHTIMTYVVQKRKEYMDNLRLSSKYRFIIKMSKNGNDLPNNLQTVSTEDLVNIWWTFHL